MMRENRQHGRHSADQEQIESTAVVYRDHDDNVLQIELYRHGLYDFCEHCNDLFIVERDGIAWDCDTCGGGRARVVQEVFC